MAVTWDDKGFKGISGKYEILIVPVQDSWTPIVWVGKTHISTLEPVDSKALAQKNSEQYLQELTKATTRLMDRIGYNDPVGSGDEGDEGDE